MSRLDDTVAAISTPPGEGGIGIIRISGSESKAVLSKIFREGRRTGGGGGSLDSGAVDGGEGFDSSAVDGGGGFDSSAVDGGGGRSLGESRGGGKPGGSTGGGFDSSAVDGGGGFDSSAVDGGGGRSLGESRGGGKPGGSADAGGGGLDGHAGRFEDRHMRYGHVVAQDGAVIDEAFAVFMEKPRTYTGEDVAEIHCHGSILALRRALARIFAEGVRPAEPGEFTKRAFLNGRLDLAQAEAVIDLIKAKTEKSFDAAIQQLDGSLSMCIKSLRTELTGLLADIAADLDYPEEDEAQIDRALLGESLEAVRRQLEGLAGSAQSGKILREGLKAVICGKPNVGKSSLMNALLGEQRVIVADTPGTTRDIIEDGANIDGVYVRFFDTAGIRQTEDDVEQIGIDRSKGAFNSSDLVLLVLDSSAPLDGEDLEIMRHVGGRPAIALMNKSDLPVRMAPGDVAAALPGAAIIPASVKNGDGIGRLKQEISGLVYQGRATQGGSAALTNARQEDAARRALAEMDDALAAFRSGETLDLVEIPIRAAWEFLGEITGESAAEDIIERVFEKFCLGK